MHRSQYDIVGKILPLLALWTVLASAVSAQPNVSRQEKEFEEIVVGLEIPKLIREDLFVQFDGQTVYLPLVRLFTLLDINITADLTNNIFSGFYISKNDRYEFDFSGYHIKVMGKEFPYLASDYYLGPDDLYIKVDLFKKMFNLNMQFDFSLMRVYMPLNRDLPAFQKVQRKIARQKLQERTQALKDIVRLSHRREYFSGGSADWVISTNPVGGRNKHSYRLDVGTLLLGGDLELTFGGNSDALWESNQFDYKWHYYVNDGKWLSQAEIGEVNAGGSLARGLKGALITNRPQIRRKYFQTLNLKDYLGDGWEVELYVDNKLVDFMVTDVDGFYTFNTDIYYGASNIELKMYGPNGEFRTEDQIIRVPYNLIPKGEFEYAVSGGEAKVNYLQRKYVQANAYYGLLSRLTMGFNFDLPIGSADGEKPTGGLDATYQIVGNLTANASVAPNHSIKSALNYSQPSVLNINLAFTKYYENLVRNPLRQQYNMSFAISSPTKIRGHYLGLRYNVTMDKYPALLSTNMSYGFNTSVVGMNLTYMGKYKYSDYTTKVTTSLSSQLLVSTRYLKFIRPQLRLEYDHNLNQMSRFGIYFIKRLFRNGQINLSLERNLLTKTNTIMLNFNLLTSFADFTSRVVHTPSGISASQLQRGSIRFDRESHSLQFDRKNSVGTGSAVVRPFLDNNFNGVMDEEETYLTGLRAKINGARLNPKGKKKEYYYDGLRPYEDYMVQIDQYSLDNPLLKPTNENFQVKINPNVVTAIHVPVVTASEISGLVERQMGQVKAGVGGFKIILTNVSKETIIELTSFNSGEYYYLGLIPGSYRACIDPQQLAKYGYVSQPAQIEFELKPVEGGSLVENINFLLLPKETAAGK